MSQMAAAALLIQMLAHLVAVAVAVVLMAAAAAAAIAVAAAVNTVNQ